MNQTKSRNIHVQLVLLLVIAFIVKAIAAYTLELGNDEVYYLSYALYPAISHFDHPPIVGFLIQLTTLNLTYSCDFLVRLGPLILGTASIFIIYLIGKDFKNERTGLIAAYLATASIYVTVICGVLIQPDSPMVFFALLSFYFFSKFIPFSPDKARQLHIWLAFLFLGLAIYSKIQSVYLALGVLLYILFFNRAWFKKIIMYIGALIPLIFIGLIIYWNYQHDFITYTYQGDRVSLFSLDIKPLYFLREIGGEIGYYNPINFVIIIMALFTLKKRKFIELNYYRFTFWCSIPLIATVLYVSLYSATLPHWVGISYIFLFILAGAYLDSRLKTLKFPAIYAYIVLVIGILAVCVVQYGWFIPGSYTPKKGVNYTHYNPTNPPEKWETSLGHNEGTLDMYGWGQINNIYKDFIKKYPEYKKSPIVDCQWFTAAHVDHYVAIPNNVKLLVYGPIDNIHEYYWITPERGSLKQNQDALYITTSHYYLAPADRLMKYFTGYKLLAQAPVYRSGNIVEFVFIYKMEGFKGSADAKASTVVAMAYK